MGLRAPSVPAEVARRSLHFVLAPFPGASWTAPSPLLNRLAALVGAAPDPSPPPAFGSLFATERSSPQPLRMRPATANPTTAQAVRAVRRTRTLKSLMQDSSLLQSRVWKR